MADSQQEMVDVPRDPRMDNTGNKLGGGKPKGSKRTVTLVKELYENQLLAVSLDRMPAIMERIASDAVDDDLPDHIRQKAQQMIIQAAQKAGDQAIEAEKIDQGMDGLEIDISRDGLLIKQGRNQVRIGGGTSGQEGVDDEMVPYSSYPSVPYKELPDGFKDEEYMPCAPHTSIPLMEFVGPHFDPKTLTQCFIPRKHNDPYLNPEMKYKECLCIDRPVSMNFNVEVIDG